MPNFSKFITDCGGNHQKVVDHLRFGNSKAQPISDVLGNFRQKEWIPLVGTVTSTAYLKTEQKYVVIRTMRWLYPNSDGWLQGDSARPNRSKLL